MDLGDESSTPQGFSPHNLEVLEAFEKGSTVWASKLQREFTLTSFNQKVTSLTGPVHGYWEARTSQQDHYGPPSKTIVGGYGQARTNQVFEPSDLTMAFDARGRRRQPYSSGDEGRG